MAVLSKFLQAAAGILAFHIASTTPTPVELQRRTTVLAYDDIVGFAQTVPSGNVGEIYTTYKPYLKVVNGCVPFPAVDAAGDVSGGLPISGLDGNTDCTSSSGQIYARQGAYGDYYAVMYSWFMPKDEPSWELGHVYDWEGVIIWLASNTSTTAGNILAVCPSAHGAWDCSTDGYTLSGTSALIQYESYWPLDHSCGLTTSLGGTQPLIAWESLTTAARNTLSTYDFGSAIVPFDDSTWDSNLAKATF